MAVLARPCEQAIVIPMDKKKEFFEDSRKANTSKRMTDRLSHVNAAARGSRVSIRNDKD